MINVNWNAISPEFLVRHADAQINCLGFQVHHVDAQSKNAKNSKNSRLKTELSDELLIDNFQFFDADINVTYLETWGLGEFFIFKL